jgi:hypothetical protein
LPEGVGLRLEAEVEGYGLRQRIGQRKGDPGGDHEERALEGIGVGLIHAVSFQDHASTRGNAAFIPAGAGMADTFSFIRTVTVGPGVSPDLLTLALRQGARGL